MILKFLGIGIFPTIIIAIIAIYLLYTLYKGFKYDKLSNEKDDLQHKVNEQDKKNKELIEQIQHKDNLITIIESTNKNYIFDKVATLYADYKIFSDKKTGHFFNKKELLRINELKEIIKQEREKLYEAEFVQNVVYTFFPYLKSYVDKLQTLPPAEKVQINKNIISKYNEINNLQNWIKEKQIKESRANAIQSRANEIQNRANEIQCKNQYLENILKEKDELSSLVKDNDVFSKIASLYADYRLLQYDISEKYLRTKPNPAIEEAKRIKELKAETKSYIEKYKQMKYQYDLLFDIFPELSEYVDNLEDLRNYKSLSDLEENYDRVKDWISKEDYDKLSDSDRNQLALDKYISSNKSKEQIGRDYELYCGYLYREEGFSVIQYGIEKKLEDLGRDIIAKKDNITYIIQCKCWSKDKTIHEKHILQLYGTSVMYKIENNNEIIKPIFITTTQYSDTAIKFAKELGVELRNIPFDNNCIFPRIKCNVNNGNKIYHLPFDQQYDTAQIKNEDEFYAFTVTDAEEKGFRRAKKYFGNN